MTEKAYHRFVVRPADAARVRVHATLAAKALFELEGYAEGYRTMLADVAEQAGATPSPDTEEARMRMQTALDQAAALRRDLAELAADAEAQGTEALRRTKISIEPNVELASPPDPADALQLLATLHVAADRIRRQLSSVKEHIEPVIDALGEVDDEPTAGLVGRMEAFLRIARTT